MLEESPTRMFHCDVWLPSFFLAVFSAASSGRDDGGVSTGAAKARAR